MNESKVKHLRKQNELKRIDFEEGTFQSNGNWYYIAPLQMPYNRLVKFAQLQSDITKGARLEDAITFIYKLYMSMKTGEEGNYKESWMELYTALHDFCKPLEGYNPANVPFSNYEKYYDFCTYFILREDEDYSKYDERIAFAKKEDWKKDMYPKDFFFAVFLRLDSLTKESEIFEKAIQPQKEQK